MKFFPPKKTLAETDHCAFLQPPSGHDPLAESEVRELDVEVVVEQYVLRLNVPVYDPHVVAVLERTEHLPHDSPGFRLRQRYLAREKVEQLAVGAQLEHEKDHGLADEDVVQTDDVRVAVDALQNVRLAEQLLPHPEAVLVRVGSLTLVEHGSSDGADTFTY